MFRCYTSSETTSKIQPPKPPRLRVPYSCDICEESHWLTETDVELHRKNMHFELISEQMDKQADRFCTICMKLQDSKSNLISHIKTRHLFSGPEAKRIEREIFICDKCHHIFFNKDMLRAHIMYTHMWKPLDRKDKFFPCPKCRRNIRLSAIWFHFQKHSMPSISICDICLHHFENVVELQNHVKAHAPYYKCEICNYHPWKDTVYEAHLVEHHKSSDITNSKKIGGMMKRVFPKKTPCVSTLIKYNIHQALRGLDLPHCLQVCILCREICTNRNEARTHILRDHMSRLKTFPAGAERRRARCRCGTEFFNRVLLRHHVFKMKGHHREETEDSLELPQQSIPATMETISVSIEVPPATMETISVSIEVPPDGSEYILEEIADNTVFEEEVQLEDREVKECSIENVKKREMTYIFTEEDEEGLVTIDAETNDHVIGF